MVAVRRRIALEAHAVGDGQLGRHRPLILHIDAKFRPAQRVGIVNLLRLLNGRSRSRAVGQAQQIIGQVVVRVIARTSRARHAARKQEAAVYVRDAAAGGGLEVVEVEVVVGEAGLELVLALDVAQVHIAGELIVAEFERISGIGVADGAEGAVKAHQRLAPIIRVGGVGGKVRSRNLQCVQPIASGCEIDCRFRTRPLPRVAEIGVQHGVGVDHMAHAHADILDVAMPRARLAAIEGAAARRAQFLRIEYLERLGAVFAEDLRIVIRNEGDLGIVAGASVDKGGRPRVVVGHLLAEQRRARCADRGRDRGQIGDHHRRLRVHLARSGNGIDAAARLAIFGGEARAAWSVKIARGVGQCGACGGGRECTHPRGRRLRIVDRRIRRSLREVAVDHVGIWNRQCYTVADQLVTRGALPVVEEEKLLPAGDEFGNNHRAAEIEAVFVEYVMQNPTGRIDGALVRSHRRKIRPGVDSGSLVVVPCPAMEVVAAALGGDLDRCAARLALLGGEVVGGDADVLDRVHWRYVGDQVG